MFQLNYLFFTTFQRYVAINSKQYKKKQENIFNYLVRLIYIITPITSQVERKMIKVRSIFLKMTDASPTPGAIMRDDANA